MNMDNAQKAFNKLKKKWLISIDEIMTESETRFQVIDLILTNVLGWDRKEIKIEPHIDSGYIDYLVRAEGRGKLVIEAKKASKILIDTRNPRMNYYQLNGAALKSARDGIKQARNYCSDTGVPFAVLTTGIEWIGFMALRTDGKPPSDGKAIVFPSLESISDNFATFFDFFSKDSILNELHKVRFNEAEGRSVDSLERSYQVVEKKQITLLRKSKFASDMDQIFAEFFGSISDENNREMLARCFVETKESKETDISLQKIAKNLLNQIEVVSSDKGEELQEQIRSAILTRRGEFVLIIGNKGAGKSTFIDRFFSLILDTDLRKKSLVIIIDLANSSGDSNTIVEWLLESLKDKLESILFKNTTPTYEQLQGVFYKQYQRWMVGEHKYLYEKDKNEFKIKFGDYISKFIIDHPQKYVTYLLNDAIRSRVLMPCLVFDNTDHFPQQFQEEVFQFAQSIHRSVFSFIICPITDRTVWQLSKEGPFQSYSTRSFYLPVPSAKEILSRRVVFIRQELDKEKQERGKYFLKRGISLNISDMKAFAACIEDILVKTDYVARMVGWLSNHDIRRSLRISQRIITSPFVLLEDLVKTFLSGQTLLVQPYIISKALILGDYKWFNSENSEFVLNVFTVNPKKITSPLLKLSLLRLLIDKDNQYKDPEETYLSVDNIIDYFDPAGVSSSIIKENLQELLSYRLVQPYDPTDQVIYEDQRLRVSHSGRIHLEFSLRGDPYVSHMALVTPVRNYSLVSDIRAIMRPKLGRSDWLNIISTFIEYCLEEDKIFISLPKAPTYDSQSQLRHRLKMKWIISNNNENV